MTNRLPYEIRVDEDGVGPVLVATASWSTECSARLKLGDLHGVRLSYSAGFRGSDLSFLSHFPSLRSVEVYSSEVKNLQSLAGLPALEVLGLQTEAKTKLRSEWFPSLRVAKVQWRKGMEPLLASKRLQYLNVINFPFLDLSPLAELAQLQRLSLTSRRLASLVGIDALPLLQHLDLYSCPNLMSIEPLVKCPNIVRLEVESCRHIASQR
jgi:Leucine-rich repeat (LRR) protein